MRNLNAADRLDLGPADRLMIGDDRQRFGRRARQAARILAGPAEDMRQVGRGLEMPAPAALDQFDAMSGVALGERSKRGLDIAFADIAGDILDAERHVRRE